MEHSEEYTKYINSTAWRMKRMLVIYAAGCKCEHCGSERNLQVHHKHYDTLGHEKREDLEVLCVPCHALADEKRRVATEIYGKIRLAEARFEGWANKVDPEGYEDRDDLHERYDRWRERRDIDGYW